MDSPLLATKLRVPPQSRHLVLRARLVELLERGIGEHGYKLLLLAAPAGSGKTTLLAQWAHASRAHVAWLTVGKEDNDPDRFFRTLLAAWERVHPGVRESPLGVLLGSSEPDRDAVLAAFIDHGLACSEQTVFVLNDAHLIREPVIHDALTFLIDHLPPTLHLVLAGRAEPALPLARYRARHELLELRAEDLQFQVEETEEFLRHLAHLDLSDDEIASLHTQLEGWVAGLQLVSLTLRHRPLASPLAVSGRHRFIADYLSEEVLAHLPEETRRFLLQTSILDDLCGSLADAVTEATHGQEMLESLERENLFLMPLDDRREWFRYHRLFADFLQTELLQRHPGEVTALHRRAARWYLAHDLPEPAFRHAVAGNDPDQVTAIIDRYENLMLHGGELRVLQAWLDALPEAWYAAFPLLGLARAGVFAFSGALDACVRCVDDVEQRLAPTASDDTRWQQARVTAFRCFIACFQNDLERAEMFASQALRDLPEEHPERADVYHALGETYGRHGRWQQAREHYLKALDVSRTPTLTLRAAHVFGALADLDLRQGRLRDADANWHKALAAVQEPANWGRLPLPVIGWIDLRLGEILYERDELEAAWDHLSRGLARAELGGDARSLIAGCLMTCRLKLAQGDLESAHWWSRQHSRTGPVVSSAARSSSGWRKIASAPPSTGPMRCSATTRLPSGRRAKPRNWPWPAC